MKKSKGVKLVLITAVLASCNKQEKEWESANKVYLRSDTTAPYTRANNHALIGAALWFYAFRPYGNFSNGMYRRAGYYSGALNERSNFGNNRFKSGVARGGFGRSGYSVSS